jgi:putative ABC transport system substrate-binding protein
MNRRDLIKVLGGAATAWPILADAQPARLPTIGLMGSGSAAEQTPWTAAFVQRLGELGWSEGRTITIEYRWAEGRTERFGEIAAEFVRLKVDAILTHNTPPTLAAKQATAVIPIVFANAGDPVGSGIVASLARPGGNVTGLSSQAADTVGKRLELLREVVADLRRVAVLTDPSNTSAVVEMREIEAAARALALDVSTFEFRRSEDLDSTFAAMKDRVQAVDVLAFPLVFVNRARINGLALAAGLPTMYVVREYVTAGGLMSYGPNWPAMWRRSADFVDKILRGAKPVDIPVEQPTQFDLVINLKTAKALGLDIPASLLARADEVIE